MWVSPLVTQMCECTITYTADDNLHDMRMRRYFGAKYWKFYACAESKQPFFFTAASWSPWSKVVLLAVMESSEGSKSSMSVFGSPPEPIFNESKNGLSNELLLDAFKFLSSKNDVAVRGAVPDETGGCFKSGQPVEFLFELCRHFELGTDVQYRAADLYHKFMTNHIVELYQVKL